MKEILVTGGAGYIGSHVVKMLAEKGYNPIVYDNLVNGHKDFVKDYELIQGDIGDYDKLTSIFKSRKIECIMNFASYIAVGESVQKPIMYYENNVSRTIMLLKSMIDNGVDKIIFSSTAAVYGYPQSIPITEDTLLKPINPYGKTKLVIENVLEDIDNSNIIKSIRFRYFNAAGADPSGKIGESHIPETHLIPLIIRSIIDKDYHLTVFGDDYKTNDGTCIRDYIHVNDLASAHISGLESLLAGNDSNFYNLGNAKGFSVNEVIESVKRVSGKIPKIKKGPRREGDPDILVASSDKAHKDLKWSPQMPDIDDIVDTAWKWEIKGFRKGY